MSDEQWRQLHGILTLLGIYAGIGLALLFVIMVKLVQIRAELRKHRP